MDSQELIEHARRIKGNIGRQGWTGVKSEICEFLKNYGGPNNSFYNSARNVGGYGGSEELTSILESFFFLVDAGRHSEVSPERRAQLDVVSDLLGQAESLLAAKDVHPAAPAVLIGATLEEFLRNWAESAGLSLGDNKPGIENYAGLLYSNNLIVKQDKKDITSWAGTRNDAAHGRWEEVGDKKRIRLMLEGVNLFMRKYGM